MMKKLFLFLALLLSVTTAFAVPAKGGQTKELTLTTGATVIATLVGDEFCHYWIDAQGKCYQAVGSSGLFQLVDDAAAMSRGNDRRAATNQERIRRLTQRRSASEQGITGNKKGIIILVNFADVAFGEGHDNALFQLIANQENFNDAPFKGSMHDYFYAQSEGKFNLTFDVVGPVTVSQTQAYYGGNDSKGNDQHPAEMVMEAINLVDGDVDFSLYDWNGDNEVDQVYVVYAGQGEADGGAANTIWPHEWNLQSAGISEANRTKDRVVISTYACGSELNGSNAICGIGTMCHEFSHCLGYPDFYDTDYSGGQGMFMWDLMSSGNYNGNGYQPAGYTAYERWVAGWKTPITLSTSCAVDNMAALQDNGATYIIYNKGNPNEYFLLENRQKVGWDESLPGVGLLITHVDYDATAWNRNKVNDDPQHQRMTWVPADNEYQVRYANGRYNYLVGGAANDPFPYGSVNAFNSSTKPAATLYNVNVDGSYFLDASVENITQNGDGTVSFRFVTDDAVYKRATDVSDIATGSRCIIVDKDAKMAATDLTKKYLESEAVDYDGDEVRLPDGNNVAVFTVTKTDDGYAFQNASGEYLGSTKTKVLTYGSTPEYWTLTADEERGIIMQHATYGTMCYNVQAPRFNVYTSGSYNGRDVRYAYLYVKDTEVIAAPAISGTTPFDDHTAVTITAAEGTTIYYTTDGTKPTTASNLYSTPFDLTATTTVRAIATKGGKESDDATYTVTKNPVFTVEASHATGTYFSPFTVTFTPRYGTAPYTMNIETHDLLGVSSYGNLQDPISINVSCDGYFTVTATDSKGATFTDRFDYKLGVFSRATIFAPVTDLSQLEAGKQVILVSKTLYNNNAYNKWYVMGREGTTDRLGVAVSDDVSTPPAVIQATADHCVMLLGGSNGAWNLRDVDADAYLQAISSTDRQLGIGMLNDNARLTLAINGDDKHATIVFQGSSTNKYLGFTHNGNNGPRFTCFESDEVPYSYLYVEAPELASEWTGTGTEADPYVVCNATTWNLLATRVNSGTSTYSGKHFRLDCDISVTEMVGESEANSFQGTFDGYGHTITFNVTTNGNECAPFRWVKNATIKRLTVKGSITTSAQFAAGIVCRAFGNTTLTACRSNIYITATRNGDGSHGGLVAVVNHIGANSSNIGKLTLTNCLFDGALTTSNGTNQCGGFVSFNHGNTVEFYNCLFAPFDVTDGMGDGTFIRTGGTGTKTFSHCYYTKTFGTAQGTEGSTAYQYIDALLANLGAGWEERSLPANECALQPVIGTATLNGSGTESAPYQIGTSADWALFVQQVNSGSSFSGKYVQLTNSITVTTMAGNSTHKFSGTFIGNGKTLTVSYGTSGSPLTEEYAAPLRYVDGATISNLTVDGNIYTNAQFAAGVAGLIVGNSSITGCHSDVSIHSTVNGDGTHGGLVAVVKDDVNSPAITISNSWFTGRLLGSATTHCGGLVGSNTEKLTLTNCLFCPAEITVKNLESSTIVRNSSAPCTINNCHYTMPIGDEQGVRVSPAKPVSTIGVKWTGPDGGTYYLDATVSFTTVYELTGETVGLDLTVTDAHDGTYTPGSGLTVKVTNENGQQVSANSLNTAGTYTLTIQEAGNIAGSWSEKFVILAPLALAGEGTAQSPYQVTSIADMQKIAAFVNSGRDEFAGKHFLLKNNLEYGGTVNNHVAIGCYDNEEGADYDRYFRGTFDSGGHTISGLNIHYTGKSNSDSFKGVFGQLGEEGTVKNLMLAGSALTAYRVVGGIVGYNEGTIENCRVHSDVTLHHITPSIYYADYGGIAGYSNGTVTGCVSAATVTQAANVQAKGMGGIVGNNDGTISNCLYIGSNVEGYEHVGAIVGNEDGGCLTSYYKSTNRSLSAAGADGYSRKTMRAFAYNTAPIDLSAYTKTEYSNGLDLYESANDYVMSFGGVYYYGGLMLLSGDDNTDRIADAAGESYDVTLSNRTLYKDGAWNTLCLPFEVSVTSATLSGDNVVAMTLNTASSELSNGTLTLNFTDVSSGEQVGVIPAGTPFIIKWNESGSDIVTPVFNSVTITTTTNDATANDGSVTFTGTYAPVAIDNTGDNTKLYLGASNTLYWPNAAMTIGANRAYFQLAEGITAGEKPSTVPSAGGGQQIRSFNLNFGEGEATGVTTTNFTDADDVWFTLDGRKIVNSQSSNRQLPRGIYINKGKKVVIK